MQARVAEAPIEELEADALVLAFSEEASRPESPQTGPTPWEALDEACGGLITRTLASRAFTGKANRCVAVPTDGHDTGKARFTDLVLVGLGPAGDIDLETWRRSIASATRTSRARGAHSLVIGAGTASAVANLEELAAAATEAARLTTYRYTAYKPIKDATELEAITVATVGDASSDPASLASLTEAVDQARIIADATCWARELINTPPNDKRPPQLANAAAKMAAECGLECEILDEPAIEALGMNALLAVGRGSSVEPRLVVLQHRGRNADGQPTALVGKGITFDTGGISLKPPAKMDEMKADMSGAAAVLATMRAVAQLDLPTTVVGVVPMAENMPSADAYRPGDIIRALNGKTIEVLNTDAEGRLVLADALAYTVERFQPRAMVDLATLTGACVVALGETVAGLMSDHDHLATDLLAASHRTGDTIWRLPLFDVYQDLIDSKVADIKNTGGRYAGALTAGKFLQNFVGDTPWAHLDIAGPAYLDKGSGYRTRGGTGFGVRLLVDWLKSSS